MAQFLRLKDAEDDLGRPKRQSSREYISDEQKITRQAIKEIAKSLTSDGKKRTAKEVTEEAFGKYSRTIQSLSHDAHDREDEPIDECACVGLHLYALGISHATAQKLKPYIIKGIEEFDGVD